MINIAIKDLKIFLADKKAVLLSFLLPIGLISLFAVAFGGAFQNDTQRPTNLMLADEDSTTSSIALRQKLDSLKGLNIIPVNKDEAIARVESGKSKGVLVISKGFGKAVSSNENPPLQLYYDPAREMEIGILQQALIPTLMEYVNIESAKQAVKSDISKNFQLSEEIMAGIYAKVEEFFAGREGASASESMDILELTPVIKNKKASWGLIQAVAGVAVMMILFSVAAIGSSVLEEKENGTLKRLLITPVKRHGILLGKLLVALILSTIQLIIMFVFTWLVFGLNILIDIPSLIVMILSTAFACSGFGVLLAAISQSRKQVESLSVIIILVMSALGGSMVPLFIMPAFMQKIAIFSVNYWSINGFYDIYWRELPFNEVFLNAFVLIGIGLLLTLISSLLFKRNVLKVS